MEGLLVLPQDINITPVRELPADLREQIQAEEGDYAITRPRSRTPSKIVDPQTMALLTEFDKPKTIVEAVLDISKTLGIPASRLLEDAFPVLQAFYAQKLLVDAGSQEEVRIEAALEPGARVANATVSRSVQVVEDTEIYRAVLDDGTEAALKIARGPAGNMIDREATILSALNGASGPKLLSAGKTDEGRTYLLMEWIDGVDAMEAVKAIREERRGHDLPYVLALCVGILDAYADLHSHGVVHCDVHGRNLQITKDGRVRVLDFGMARLPQIPSLSKAPAGGVPAFYTPEFARAILDNTAPPQGSFQSEQYSVAALLYWIIAGNHYLDFSMVREELARQILNEEPLQLKERGVDGLERIDAVLRKALCKKPELRFASMGDFAAEFRAALSRGGARQTSAASKSAGNSDFVDRVLRDLEDPRRDVPARGMVAPSMSVTYGKAGIAHAIHRIAAARNDSKLLSLADLWADESAAGIASADAFYSESIHITPEIVGRVSPYHTASGIFAVQALIANAMGDGAAMQHAIEQFMVATSEPCDNIDVTLGTSSIVLALASLVDAIATAGAPRPEGLIERGNELVADIWNKLDVQPAIRDARKYEYLGIAHGWAGFCYTALRWALASGSPLPGSLEDRLQQLLAFAELKGNGVRWPWGATKGGGQMLPGWCNGVAGQVFLWTLAHRMIGKSTYLDMAERCAREAASFEAGLHTLCCGSAGQAYALLALYKHTRDRHWLHGAQAQVAQAVRVADAVKKQSGPDIPFSLYKGAVGVAVLAAEMERPEFSSMPFFEQEPWK